MRPKHYSTTESHLRCPDRCIDTIGLGVDSANLTGATRVYERAGMYAVSEFALYEKELKTGEG